MMIAVLFLAVVVAIAINEDKAALGLLGVAVFIYVAGLKGSTDALLATAISYTFGY
jgi:hypothetical protein